LAGEGDASDGVTRAYSKDDFIRTAHANYIIFGASALSIAYAAYAVYDLRKIEMRADTIKI